ncbi:MAG: hypothetical protein ACOC38_13285 [Promethearchaeia archaeon]
MTNTNRAKAFVIVGVVLCIVAFIPDVIVRNGDFMDGGTYYGHVVQTTGSITVDLDIYPLGNESFDILVMTYDEALTAFEEESLENCTILYEIEEVEQHTEVLPLSSGTYVAFVTPSNSSAKGAYFELHVFRTIPHPRVLVVAAVMFGIAAVDVIVRRRQTPK